MSNSFEAGIIEFFEQQADSDAIYDLAYSVVTANGNYSRSHKWSKIMSTIETAIDFYMCEGMTEQSAINEAVSKTTYYACIKTIMDEVSIRNSLSEQDYEVIAAEDDRRLNFEDALVEFDTTQPSSISGRGVSPMTQRYNESRQSNRVMQNAPTNPRVSKGLQKANVNFDRIRTAPTSNEAPRESESKNKRLQARAAKQNTVNVVEIEKECFAVEHFDLDAYPTHVALTAMSRKEEISPSRLDAVLEATLAEQASNENKLATDENLEDLVIDERQPFDVYVDASTDLFTSVSQARTFLHSNDVLEADSLVLDVYSPITKLIAVHTEEEIFSLLSELELNKLDDCKSIASIFEQLKRIRLNCKEQGNTLETFTINSMLNDFANELANRLVNNAIPHQITTDDAIQDWVEIEKHVIKYLIDDHSAGKPITQKATVKREISEIWSKYLKDNLSDALRFIQTFLVLQEEEDGQRQLLKGYGVKVEEKQRALCQQHLAAILDLPISSRDLDIYTNHKSSFKVDNRAPNLLEMIDKFIDRVSTNEIVEVDNYYISFAERNVFKIDRINTKDVEAGYYYLLS